MSGAEKRTGFMKRSANEALLTLADSSLRLATRYAPGSPGYLVDLGRFDLTSNSASVRGRARPLFEQALKEARKGKDLAGALARRGRDGDDVVAALRGSRRPQHLQRDRAEREGPHLHEGSAIDRVLRRSADDSRRSAGLVGRRRISQGVRVLLRGAARAAGKSERVRHIYRALVDRQRWIELEHIARVRLIDDHTDGVGVAEPRTRRAPAWRRAPVESRLRQRPRVPAGDRARAHHESLAHRHAEGQHQPQSPPDIGARERRAHVLADGRSALGDIGQRGAKRVLEPRGVRGAAVLGGGVRVAWRGHRSRRRVRALRAAAGGDLVPAGCDQAVGASHPHSLVVQHRGDVSVSPAADIRRGDARSG